MTSLGPIHYGKHIFKFHNSATGLIQMNTIFLEFEFYIWQFHLHVTLKNRVQHHILSSYRLVWQKNLPTEVAALFYSTSRPYTKYTEAMFQYGC